MTSEQIEPTRVHQAPESSNATNRIMSTVRDPEPESSFSAIVPSGWELVPEPSTPTIPTSLNSGPVAESSRTRQSWADMAQEEDELEDTEDETRLRRDEEERAGDRGKWKMELSREQKELNRFRNVTRKKEYVCLERIRGKITNIVDGLELHTGVFSPIEQKRIVDFVNHLLDKGRNGELGGMFSYNNFHTKFYQYCRTFLGVMCLATINLVVHSLKILCISMKQQLIIIMC